MKTTSSVRPLWVASAVSALVTVGCARRPNLLSLYDSWHGVSPTGDIVERVEPHTGVDVAMAIGDDVIASIDGIVKTVRFDDNEGVVIEVIDRYPVLDQSTQGAALVASYVHLRSSAVRVGEVVSRGQKLGEVGLFVASGGVVHVHWQRCRSVCTRGTTLDPMLALPECYSAGTRYGQAQLTYPVRC